MVTPEIEKHISANGNMTKKHIMAANFLGGLSWGVGSAIGASVVLAIVAWILKGLGVFTDISNFFPQSYR